MVTTIKPRVKKFARNIKNNSTKSEIDLGIQLNGKQMKGHDFHRQKTLANYIADFFCHERMLVIEIDGYSRLLEEVQDKDAKKEKKLNET
jgi:very-short-patch-repair endonuclease